jgi:iron complex outermembrane receptor protein
MATGGQGRQQPAALYLPAGVRQYEAGNNADVNAKDYAGSLRWNIDFNPEHSLYVQGSAQHFDRQQVWRACDALHSFSPN